MSEHSATVHYSAPNRTVGQVPFDRMILCNVTVIDLVLEGAGTSMPCRERAAGQRDLRVLQSVGW